MENLEKDDVLPWEDNPHDQIVVKIPVAMFCRIATEEGKRVDPNTATVIEHYVNEADVYGICKNVEGFVVRMKFAFNPEQNFAVAWIDLPESTRDILNARINHGDFDDTPFFPHR